MTYTPSPLASYMMNRFSFSSVGEGLLFVAINSTPQLFKEKALLEVSNKVHDMSIQFSSEFRLHAALKSLWHLKNEDRIWRLLNTGFSCKAKDKEGNPAYAYLFYNHLGGYQPSVALVKRIVEEEPDVVNHYYMYCRPYSRIPMLGWYYSREKLDELEEIMKPTH
jgi:hypothetical protein